MTQTNNLAHKSILITGGNSGVGADMAKTFADMGAKVWITGRRQDALDNVAAYSPNIRAIQADVAVEADVIRTFETCGSVDIVIANAGISKGVSFVKTSLADWQNMVDVNMTGVFLTMREGLKVMPKDWGRMIVISSIAGVRGAPNAAAYAATKHGVVGLVRSVSHEMAKTGVTVNAICPGYLDTEMTDRNIEIIMQKTGMSAKDAAGLLTVNNPQGRMIAASEVTDAALYLMGDGAVGVNGHTMMIAGGDM